MLVKEKNTTATDTKHQKKGNFKHKNQNPNAAPLFQKTLFRNIDVRTNGWRISEQKESLRNRYVLVLALVLKISLR